MNNTNSNHTGLSINEEVISNVNVEGIIAGYRYRVVNVATDATPWGSFVHYCLRDITTGGGVDRWVPACRLIVTPVKPAQA